MRQTRKAECFKCRKPITETEIGVLVKKPIKSEYTFIILHSKCAGYRVEPTNTLLTDFIANFRLAEGSVYTKENNYGLGKEYWTLGAGLPKWSIEIIKAICKQEGMKKGQLLRKWILERIVMELPVSND